MWVYLRRRRGQSADVLQDSRFTKGSYSEFMTVFAKVSRNNVVCNASSFADVV